MIPFENEVRAYLDQTGLVYEDHCDSLEQLDFGFGDREARRHFDFDVKEKRRRYNVRNWGAQIPQEHLFIFDDLAARKVLAYAPNSGIVVRDNVRGLYFFFSVVDLFLMPKLRVNRAIRKNVQGLKGKWLIDLRNGLLCVSLEDVFHGIDAYLERRRDIFTTVLECYGAYQGEAIPVQGRTRRPQHWQTDVDETRS